MNAARFKKRLLLTVASGCLLVLLLELASFVYLSVADGKLYSPEHLSARREAVILANDATHRTAAAHDPLPQRPECIQANEVIHPYFGFANDLSRLSVKPMDGFDFGFYSSESVVNRRSDDTLIVCITGGSFAGNIVSFGLETLRERLSAIPAFDGRRLLFVNLTQGGFKQPQQLMAISYLMVLGAEFDLIINVDGFNEVALPPSENLPMGVFPSFPRSWHWRSQTAASFEDLNLSPMFDDVARLRLQRVDAATWFGEAPQRYSVSASLLWTILDERMDHALAAKERALSGSNRGAGRYAQTGPHSEFTSMDQLFEHLASVWSQSSLQLFQLCQANHIAYFHFLQPNQYVPHSKPMGQEERATAILREGGYRPCVLQGYPVLRRRGQRLVEHGVPFTDLTLVFQDVHDPVYVDTCCHVGEFGSRIATEAIAAVLQDHFR